MAHQSLPIKSKRLFISIRITSNIGILVSTASMLARRCFRLRVPTIAVCTSGLARTYPSERTMWSRDTLDIGLGFNIAWARLNRSRLVPVNPSDPPTSDVLSQVAFPTYPSLKQTPHDILRLSMEILVMKIQCTLICKTTRI